MPIMNFSPSLGIQVEEFIMAMYHDRGDPVAPDFTKADFTIDGAWHDLDLSAIVPAAGANHLVLLYLHIVFAGDALPSQYIEIRKNGNVNEINIVKKESEAGTTKHDDGVWVMLDGNRIIEYKITNIPADWTTLELSVRGWVTD